MMQCSFVSNNNIMIKFISLLLHYCIWSFNYWAITWWFESEFAMKKQVLGIKPLLSELDNFLMYFLLFFRSLGLLILGLVAIQLLKHLCKLLDFLFVNLFHVCFIIFFFFWINLDSAVWKEFYSLIFQFICFFQFFIFLCDIRYLALNSS